MALDNQQRHSMHTSFGGFQPPSLGSVQFTNPWTSASTQNHLIASSIPSDVSGLGSMVKPDMRTSVPASYQSTSGIPTSNPGRHLTSNLTSNMLSHSSDYMKSEMLHFGGANSPFGGDMSMSGSSAPSPTAITSFVPSFAPPVDFSTHHRNHYPMSNNDRRMSQPAMSNTMFLGSPVEAPRPRQNSLMEWTTSNNARPMIQPPRSTNNQFSDTLDSARGMVAMSQTPRQHRQRSDGSQHGFYPGHSTNSSISSTASNYGYYGGGSVDSSATDYSDPAGFPTEPPRPSLPRPVGIQSVPVQGALMTTFSSKITSSTQKKHKCKVCDKRFTRPSSLQTHTYSHTGEKRKLPYTLTAECKTNLPFDSICMRG